MLHRRPCQPLRVRWLSRPPQFPPRRPHRSDERAVVADVRDAALENFRPEDYDPAAIREHALQWGSDRFRARVREAVVDVAATRASR